MKSNFKIFLALIIAIFSSNLIFAQPVPPSNLSGSTLRTWLKTNWYDSYHNQLGYDGAREQMYSFIDKKTDGQVYCVYTQFHQTATFTTFLDPINAEHTIPQSWFGSSNPMVSDLFHLYPTHKDVNGVRSNYPFAELTDSQTDKWYIVNSNNTGYTTLTSPPATNADAYSKFNSGTSFEPPLNHKGDLARSAFYFYTVYPTQAGAISELCDLNTLYAWHLADPVDAWEQLRNDRIESKQGNRNPYIDYPEIACRAWGLTCATDIESIQNSKITIFPNPTSDLLNIEFYLPSETFVNIDIYDITGRKVANIIDNEQLNGNQNIEWNFSSSDYNFQNGIYFINIVSENQNIYEKIIYNK